MKITFLISPDGLEKTFRQHRLKTNLKFPKKIYHAIFLHICSICWLCWSGAVNWKMSHWGESFILPHVEFWAQSNEYCVANSLNLHWGTGDQTKLWAVRQHETVSLCWILKLFATFFVLILFSVFLFSKQHYGFGEAEEEKHKVNKIIPGSSSLAILPSV